ncbi:hypothetical protein Taro_025088 [Colocasia esculenta]|uniref:Uncharacterized protein n=1 Tax=Colocasia esculenta TaxID=4460 RepID=A0A843V7Z7_COLES|nr:hypothetical protein [Colocasia esculenta]
MEGRSEVNDSLENSEEAPHLKSKENEQSSCPQNFSAMESPALFASQEISWSEQLFSHRFHELISDTLEGKNMLMSPSSQAKSEDLERHLHSTGDADEIVEELTLTNYKNPRLPIASCSNSGDDTVKKSMWQNLYKLGGEPRVSTPKEPVTTACEDTRNVFLNQLRPRRPFPNSPANQIPSMVSEHLTEGANFTSSGNTRTTYLGGIRTKVLSARGYPEFLVKTSLKGKGIAYRNPCSYDACKPKIQSHSNEVGRDDAGKSSDKTRSSTAKDEDIALNGWGSAFVPESCSGINLRQWLNSAKHRIDKFQRLQIFKQILELVDSSHSQDVALEHLRPCFFMLVPPNHVKYIGSFISQVHKDVPKLAIGHGVSYATDQLKRKRNLEVGERFYELAPAKQRKASGQVKLDGRCSLVEDKVALQVDSAIVRDFGKLNQNSDYGISALSGNSFQQPVCDIVQLEKMWYTSPEEFYGNTSTFSSNIYSLGVLLFELFCYFESWEVHTTAMMDLRHRILPPNFLSECPKEAGFCLWLLHPEPSSRPKSRDVLLCEFMSEMQDLNSVDRALTSIDEEDAEVELLLHFLVCVKEQKEKEAAKLMENLRCLGADINEVERRNSSRMELIHVRNSSSSIYEIPDESMHPERTSSLSRPGMNELKLTRNIDQLEQAYFSMRSEIEISSANSAARTDTDVLRIRDEWSLTQHIAEECYSSKEPDRSGAFFDGFCKYAKYSKFEVRGTIRNSDILNSANVICSLSFDRDEDYLAAAGISKKIKIFEFDALLSENVDVHYPVVEMQSKSRLSCVCWNSYIKNYLASTDYDGVVQLWDASTGQGFTRYADHQKRAWSVDFSQVDPTKLASGSDDCSVKLWSIKEACFTDLCSYFPDKNCISTIRSVANICCVQFSSHSTHFLAFGSADYKVYCYDLRNTRIPWCTLAGHGKAVSYVKFVDSQTLVSASTDNTLKLWDLEKTNSCGFSTAACSLTLTGHTNEKNFVGLSVSDGYIACGSETNEIYAYYRSLPMPITSHKFGSMDPITGLEIAEDNGQFVSSVCWRGKSNMVVAANSSGSIKLLHMV